MVGIVCEYNPFHKGHLYQLQAARRALGEDAAAVCVMSGDFVQRGEAALFDKFTRAEAACRAGADLVLELPLPWCLSSAEGFAFGAVSILKGMGCEALSFGSESADLAALEALADFALSPDALAAVYARMDRDETLSFARARQLEAAARLGERAALLLNPNDILAVEYLKALRRLDADMEPLPVRRAGTGHDSREGEGFASAMLLREKFERGEDPAEFIPEPAMGVFRRETEAGRTRDKSALEIALLSRLYQMKSADFDRLPDAGGGAGRRLYKALEAASSLEAAVAAASGKRFTAARMRRMLLCAALGLCADDTKGQPPYIRPLAANERGRACLAAARGRTEIPLVNRAAELKRLDAEARRLFALGAEAHALYRLQFVTNVDRKADADWKRSMTFV